MAIVLTRSLETPGRARVLPFLELKFRVKPWVEANGARSAFHVFQRLHEQPRRAALVAKWASILPLNLFSLRALPAKAFAIGAHLETRGTLDATRK